MKVRGISRRKILKSVWVTPTLLSMNLPVHAQTSCTSRDIVGLWRISSPTDTFELRLNIDGTTDSPIDYQWVISQGVIELESFIGVSEIPIYRGPLTTSCDSFSGTVQFFTIPITTETFTATKIG